MLIILCGHYPLHENFPSTSEYLLNSRSLLLQLTLTPDQPTLLAQLSMPLQLTLTLLQPTHTLLQLPSLKVQMDGIA
jgi:hypothetical protein